MMLPTLSTLCFCTLTFYTNFGSVARPCLEQLENGDVRRLLPFPSAPIASCARDMAKPTYSQALPEDPGSSMMDSCIGP